MNLLLGDHFIGMIFSLFLSNNNRLRASYS